LTAALSGTSPGAFSIVDYNGNGDRESTLAIDSLAPGSYKDILIWPQSSLAAGTYTARVTVSGGNGISAYFDVRFTVNNAAQAAPAGIGSTDETVLGANDGTITGVTTAMEYKLSSATYYTAITAVPVTGLTPGTYNVRYAAKSNFNAGADAVVTIQAGVPALGGTAEIGGVSAIGETLTADTSLLTGGSGAFHYQWKSGSANVGTGAAFYQLQGSDAGRVITCLITREDAIGSVTAIFDNSAVVPYNITITSSGTSGGDTVATFAGNLTAITGRADDSIPLNYVLGDGGGAATNTLMFTGGTGLVNLQAAGANAAQNYTVKSRDA
jgi:hypothetical protein